jgi:hypothetical protein
MRKLTLGAIAAGALVAATAVPALAQVGVYGVDIGTPGHSYGGPYHGYDNYAPEWRAQRHYGWYRHHHQYYR